MENDGNICYAMSRSSLFDFPLKILNNFLCMQSQQLMLRSDMLMMQDTVVKTLVPDQWD